MEPLTLFVTLAGVGQLVLSGGSLAIPLVLGWKEETARLRPLVRQLFWTYGAYLLFTHVAFGLVSAFAPRWLLDGSPLAAAVTGFMATWWGVRLLLQFVWFDRSDMPPGLLPRLAEVALVALFVYLTVVYGYAFQANGGLSWTR